MAASNDQSTEPDNENLNASELGTKEYWDDLYTRELSNYTDNTQDEGTIWFDENNAEAVILKQLSKLAGQGLLFRRGQSVNNTQSESLQSQQASRFLDLGTGNGHMLFCLRGETDDDDHHGNEDSENASANGNGEGNDIWTGEMIGIDYSASSIELARRIASQKPRLLPIRFETWDFLTSSLTPGWIQEGFDVVLDKGTLDAISLMPTSSFPHNSAAAAAAADATDGGGTQKNVITLYREKVTPLLRKGGFLFVTSCNWTREELVRWLVPDDERESELVFWDEAVYPTFVFGGRKGQSIVTVVFRRREGD